MYTVLIIFVQCYIKINLRYPVLQIWTNVFLNVGSYKHVHSKNGIKKNWFHSCIFGNTFIIARPNTYELMSWIEWKANTTIKS